MPPDAMVLYAAILNFTFKMAGIFCFAIYLEKQVKNQKTDCFLILHTPAPKMSQVKINKKHRPLNVAST